MTLASDAILLYVGVPSERDHSERAVDETSEFLVVGPASVWVARKRPYSVVRGCVEELEDIRPSTARDVRERR